MKISKETLDVLLEQGYTSLEDYLTCLSEDYDLDISSVEALSNLLGESELFDGLVTSVEDASCGSYY